MFHHPGCWSCWMKHPLPPLCFSLVILTENSLTLQNSQNPPTCLSCSPAEWNALLAAARVPAPPMDQNFHLSMMAAAGRGEWHESQKKLFGGSHNYFSSVFRRGNFVVCVLQSKPVVPSSCNVKIRSDPKPKVTSKSQENTTSHMSQSIL